MMPGDAVDHFARTSFKTLANCIMATNKVTWEVNIWSNIESRYPDLFHLYDAYHDNSMLNYQEGIGDT
jgi:pectate lyase